MRRSISAADANRGFSELLREVRDGHEYVVTSHRRPVARIVPINAADRLATSARDALIARLRLAPAHAVGRWTRDELYEADR